MRILTQRRLPLLRPAVTLLLVDAIGHREELGVLQIVGQLLTLLSGPLVGAGLADQSIQV